MSTFRFVVCPKPQSYTLHGLSPYAGTYVEECVCIIGPGIATLLKSIKEGYAATYMGI